MQRTLRVSILVSGLLAAASPTALAQNTLLVGPNGPYTTIQSAIVAASPMDTVLVAPGVYHEQIDFLGKDISVVASSPAVRDSHVIDGGGTGPIVRMVLGEGPAARLDGFTISGGVGLNPNWNSSTSGGVGGLEIVQASPTIRRCWILGNQGGTSGIYGGDGGAGGVSVVSGSPRLEDCEIRSNRGGGGAGSGSGFSPGDGGDGAASVTSGSLHLSRCIFTDNSGGGGGHDGGSGGVSFWGDSLQIVECTFERNVGAASFGRSSGSYSIHGGSGAVYFDGNLLEVEQSSFHDNRGGTGASPSTTIGGSGGISAVLRDGASLVIHGSSFLGNIGAAGPCSFVANRSQSGGGEGSAIAFSIARLVLERTLVAGHTAGSAVIGRTVSPLAAYYFSEAHLSDCAIVGNTTPDSITADSLTMDRCVLSFTGPIRYPQATSAFNCIAWGNMSGAALGAGAFPGCGGRFQPRCPTVNFCCIEGGYPAGSTSGQVNVGNIGADPQFVRTPDPGPDGSWGTADDDYGDLRLSPTSPCIDRGDPAAVPTGLDFGGHPRLLDGDLDGVMRVDMGAHEFDNVRLEITGMATPGGQLTFTGSGTTGMAVFRLIGAAPGETLFAPYGAIFLDLSFAWQVFQATSIPNTTVIPLPPVPVALSLFFQDAAIDPATGAGNTSNPVEVTIR